MLGSSMEKPKGLATRCSSLYCSYVHDGQKLYRTKQMNTRKRRIFFYKINLSSQLHGSFQVHLNGILFSEFQDLERPG